MLQPQRITLSRVKRGGKLVAHETIAVEQDARDPALPLWQPALETLRPWLQQRPWQGCKPTVVLSSHGMDLVERVCSRVAIIVGGEVLAEGTVDEVRAGQTLESRFVELAGSSSEVEGLEWLHTFSD